MFSPNDWIKTLRCTYAIFTLNDVKFYEWNFSLSNVSNSLPYIPFTHSNYHAVYACYKGIPNCSHLSLEPSFAVIQDLMANASTPSTYSIMGYIPRARLFVWPLKTSFMRWVVRNHMGSKSIQDSHRLFSSNRNQRKQQQIKQPLLPCFAKQASSSIEQRWVRKTHLNGFTRVVSEHRVCL